MKLLIILLVAFILNVLIPYSWAEKVPDAKDITIASLTGTNAANTDNSANKVYWQNYSDSIFEEAKANHRPVILLSKSSDCHYCEQIESDTFSNPTVVKLINTSYTPVLIDMSRNREVFIRYKILRLPTVIIFNTNGQVKKVASGYIKSERMIQILKGNKG